MPQSRKRHGHHEFKKTAGIPATQRTKGRTLWALLFGAFGLLISFFAANNTYWVLAIGALLGAVIGYFIGKRMEEEAKKEG